MANEQGDTSARGTPHTVRPTVGVGAAAGGAGLGAVADGVATGTGKVFVNPEFLKGVNPQTAAQNPLVAAHARNVCKGLIGAQVFTLVAQFGLSEQAVGELLREVADELVGPG